LCSLDTDTKTIPTLKPKWRLDPNGEGFREELCGRRRQERLTVDMRWLAPPRGRWMGCGRR
jgi:hypothetical protein